MDFPKYQLDCGAIERILAPHAPGAKAQHATVMDGSPPQPTGKTLRYYPHIGREFVVLYVSKEKGDGKSYCCAFIPATLDELKAHLTRQNP